MYGNPDPSARGRERWQAHLEILSRLGSVRTFIPPEPEVALLVSWEGLNSEGWEKAFTAFRLFESARVQTKFIDISAVEEGTCNLRSYKLVVVPSLPFCSTESLAKLVRYQEEGGTVVAGEEEIEVADLHGRSTDAGLVYAKLPDGDEKTQDTPDASGGPVWVEPALAAADAASLSPEQVQAVPARLKALCETLSVDSQEWVYGVSVDNVAEATGTLPGYDPAPTSPDVSIEHYLYEHSSDWILPEYEKRGEERFR